MDFQRNMWAEAWVQSIAACNVLALILIAQIAVQAAAEWFGINSGVRFVASVFLWCCLAYIIQAQILLPSYRLDARNVGRMLGFTALCIGISVVVAGIGVCVAVIAAANQIYSQTTVVVIFTLLVLPLFVLISMVLPAYVVKRAYSPRAVVMRSRAQFLWITGRLLVGPVLLACLSVNLYSRVAIQLRSSRNLDYNGHLWDKEWIFQPAEIYLMIWRYSVAAAVVVLAAVILSRAFLRAEGMPGGVPA